MAGAPSAASSDLSADPHRSASGALASGRGIDHALWQVAWRDLEIVRQIGEGSFGKVYLAKWRETTVAVKVLISTQLSGGGDDDDYVPQGPNPLLAGLQKEASMMAAMRHPNVVMYLGVCVDPPLVVTEYCARGSLNDVLKRGLNSEAFAAQLDWQRRLGMALDAAKGEGDGGGRPWAWVASGAPGRGTSGAGACGQGRRAAVVGRPQARSGNPFPSVGAQRPPTAPPAPAGPAHSHTPTPSFPPPLAGMNYLHSSDPPVIHRDLKSPNLLVDKHWRVKVCDFNLSRVLEEQAVVSSLAASNPRWLAPEILSGRGYTFSSDVYSFGVILWELLTWRLPWHDCGPWQVVKQVTDDRCRPPVPADGDLPTPPFPGLPAYVDLMRDCWQHDADARPK